MARGRRWWRSLIFLGGRGRGEAAPTGGDGGERRGLLVDATAAAGSGWGRRRMAAKAAAEGGEQCQNGVLCAR
jgi:hypothetical protein